MAGEMRDRVLAGFLERHGINCLAIGVLPRWSVRRWRISRENRHLEQAIGRVVARTAASKPGGKDGTDGG